MKPHPSGVLATLSLLFLLVSAGLAQQNTPNQTDSVLNQVPSSPLIAWTDMQKPQPMPQPSPKPVPLPDPPEAQPEHPQTAQPAQPANSQAESPQRPAMQTFTGTVVKSGDKFVLRAGGKEYQLDDQAKAGEFEGKKVIVTGTLDTSSGLIHIVKIEPAS